MPNIRIIILGPIGKFSERHFPGCIVNRMESYIPIAINFLQFPKSRKIRIGPRIGYNNSFPEHNEPGIRRPELQRHISPSCTLLE